MPRQRGGGVARVGAAAPLSPLWRQPTLAQDAVGCEPMAQVFHFLPKRKLNLIHLIPSLLHLILLTRFKILQLNTVSDSNNVHPLYEFPIQYV